MGGTNLGPRLRRTGAQQVGYGTPLLGGCLPGDPGAVDEFGEEILGIDRALLGALDQEGPQPGVGPLDEDTAFSPSRRVLMCVRDSADAVPHGVPRCPCGA